MISTQLISGCRSALSTSATQYFTLFGSSNAGTTAARGSGIISVPGTIKNLRIELSAAPGIEGSNKKFDFTVYKNGNPTALIVTILETATSGTDLSNTVVCAVGDLITLQITPSNTPTSSVRATWVMDFIPDIAGQTLFMSATGQLTQNIFIPPIFGVITSATEFDIELLIPCSGTIKNLYVNSEVAPGGSNTFIFTVRKNNVDQTLSVTLTAAQTSGNNTSNSFTVAAGDRISIQRTGTSTVGLNAYGQFGLTFIPDIMGNFILSYINGSNTINRNNAIEFIASSAILALNTSETSVDQIISECTIKNIYVNLSSAPGASASYIFTLSKNATPQTLTVTIADTATNGNASTDVSIDNSNLLSTKRTKTGTPALNIKPQISYTGYIAPEITTYTKTITSDVNFIATQKTIDSDIHFKSVDNQQTLTSDVEFSLTRKNIPSDVHFKSEDNQETITSDVHFAASNTEKYILSDIKFVIEALYNINNKVNYVKQTLSNINNKINTVRRVFKNINNYVNTVKRTIFDVNNKINTKKQPLYNITNDVRFIKSWQKAGNYGFQSLGKAYIKVYIGGIEQTDADVDSIKILKSKNVAHTASFDLGRAYDSTKPDAESMVQIKYNDWVLYKGYISSITPSDTPESMTINCQNKHWLENRNKKYFKVGHKPIDDRELYYATVKQALIDEFSWTLSIGDFVPEVIDCFGLENSETISKLIEESGNYGWFYDVNENKILTTDGEGDIVNIKRQTLGTNIGLYQLIEHKFTDDVSNIINKFRVQMGERTNRTFNNTGGNRTYAAYFYYTYIDYVTPAWDITYERLSSQHSSGYGWDYHKPEEDYLYKDIYLKYDLPYLDSTLESWTDWKEPQVKIFGSPLFNCKEGILDGGYTIDYQKRQLILNDKIFRYVLDANGECISTSAPVIEVMLWKKIYCTHTTSSGSNPQSDIGNALMFFTDKMGDYPTTIFGDLNLSSLSAPTGTTYTDSKGVVHVIPTWDDTDFAEDYADWQLSKICDKKISGTIQITLDALCFYGIDLSKRLEIDGITESAMNVMSINYDLSNFTVTLELQNLRGYNRTTSLPTRGE